MTKSTLPTPEVIGEDFGSRCEVYRLTAAQVKTLLNRAPKGSKFAISASTHLPIGDGSTGFPGHACLVVGYTIALKYAEEALLHFEARGARISVSVYAHCEDSQFIIVG